jgi:hypothetical protein
MCIIWHFVEIIQYLDILIPCSVAISQESRTESRFRHVFLGIMAGDISVVLTQFSECNISKYAYPKNINKVWFYSEQENLPDQK